MSTTSNERRLVKAAATAAVVAGLAVGSYGIANAASGGSGSTTGTATGGPSRSFYRVQRSFLAAVPKLSLAEYGLDH